MKFRFAFIFLILSTQCFADKADSVRNYYQFKNKGELYIVDSNYAKALSSYKKAFTYKSPNVLDLYNALVLAYQLKDSVNAKSFFDQMAFHGLNKEKFEAYKLGLLVNKEPFYQWVSKDYDSLYWSGARTGMPAYAKVMDSLSVVDQVVRKWKTFNPTEEETHALLHADSTNLIFLENYIADHGFPGYDQIGSFEESLEGWFSSPNALFFILWHTRYTCKLLNETLLEAVVNGYFNPDEYALLIDMQLDTSIYYNALPRRIGRDNKMEFLPVPNADQVNQKRASIYLDNLANYERKLLFAEENKKTILFRLVPYWIMNCNFVEIDLRSSKVMTK